MATFTHIEGFFVNGDKLCLLLHNLIGNNPMKVFEIRFCERIEGNHENVSDDEPPSDDPHFFNIYGPEYFPENKVNDALKAFSARMTYTTPKNITGQGYELEELLKKTD